MAFEARDFRRVTERLHQDGAPEEDIRTAIGRAYYAVYGAIRQKYIAHYGHPYDTHLSHNTAGLMVKKINQTVYKKQWRDLYDLRWDSDYNYGRTLDNDDVIAARAHAQRIRDLVENSPAHKFK